MAGVTGLEPATSCVTGRRSNQLSYTPIQVRFPLYLTFFFIASIFFRFYKKNIAINILAIFFWYFSPRMVHYRTGNSGHDNYKGFLILHKNILKPLAAAAKNKRCWLTFCTTFAIALFGIIVIIRNTDVNASLSPSFADIESIENEVYDEEFSEPDNDFIAEDYASAEENAAPEPTEETRENTITVKPGDTLLSILTGLGMEYQQANEIFLATKKVYDPRDMKAGQKLQISLQWNLPENKLISIDSISTQIRSAERVVIEKDENGKYTAQLQKDELIEETNSAAGTINGSLAAAMSDEKVPARIIANFINIFSYSVDFRRDVKKGDKFEIIYENYVTPNGEVVKNGNILYASLTLGKNKTDLYRFQDKNGNADYYDAKGYAVKKTLSRKPMSYQNARISSPFGRRRHPIYKDYRVHWGIDYAAPRNTLVYAGGDGVIQVAKYNGGYGNYIKIRHNSEYSTAYGHMQKFAKGIRPGVRVKQGQVIGYVGSTGRSTGPHLHYEVIKNGKRVNPLTIKAAAGENLRGKNLTSFKRQVAQIKETHQKMLAAKETPADDGKLADAQGAAGIQAN